MSAPSPNPLLRFENVEATHADGTAALRGVSFELAAGERVALLGGNGAGKSSVFLALGGFLPFRGSIRAFDRELTGQSASEMRRRIGFVFESSDDQLLLDTLEEDVAFAPRCAGIGEAEVAERTARALEAVGLRGYERRNPRRLSFGERRLAALAGAFAQRPELLVLDEPTANLDARARRRVLDALVRFRGALLLLTHDLAAAAALTERALVLSEGRLVLSGPTDSVLWDTRAHAALGLEEDDLLALRKPASRRSP